MTADPDSPGFIRPDAPTGTADDWLKDPPASPVPVAKPKPSRKVTPLRPLDKLADQVDQAPIAAEGKPQPPDPAPPPPPSEALPPSELGGKASKDRPRGEIWDGCPVKPLGKNKGRMYFIDTLGQLRDEAKLDAQTIMNLFGQMWPKLCWHFPQWTPGSEDKPPRRKENRFDQTTAALIMGGACAEKGLFDPENAVRGVGAWADDDGALVYHTGDTMIVGGKAQTPDSHQGRIYPACPKIPHPAERADPGVSQKVLDLLSTWQWSRPEIDPMIALGMFGIQAFGGALDWRPAFWITGGAGTGKSKLQQLINHLHGGDTGLIQSTDATARGIASLLGQSTLPVALDELEPGDAGSSKERDIIQTARVASSGGRWARGSSDQKGSTGQLRAAFLFSSVLIPGVLKSQDLQRIIVLSVNPFPEGSKPPDLRAATWRTRGAELKRLVITRWPSWAERLDLWREAFAAEGIHTRDADNWATTMAMAHMLTSEALPSADELKGWTAKVATAITPDLGEAGNDASEVCTYLLSQEFDVFRRGERFTVAQWVQVAAGSPGAPPGLLGDFPQDTIGRRDRAEAANRALAKAAMKVVANGQDEPFLFLGYKAVKPLLTLFEGSQWAGGAWKQSAARIKGARPSTASRTLAGIQTRGTEIPLSSLIGIMDPPDTVTGNPVREPAQPPLGTADHSAEDWA